MKVSIIIPQLFYDLIARILPGFFFLILISIFIPIINNQIILMNTNNDPNFIESFGHGIYYIVLSYFLGWLFHAFTFLSKENSTRITNDNDKKSLKVKYQWIRLSNPAAGFRIVKLRAEVRMLETTRTATVLFILILLLFVIIDYSSSRLISLNDLNANVIKYLSGFIISLLVFIGCKKQETNAWNNYWGNINSIYNILHDVDNPIDEMNK